MKNTRYFCTLFDRNYLFKGLAMLKSLKENCENAKVFVLCMDMDTYRVLSSLSMPFVECVSLKLIETDELLTAKENRGISEYCWTLSSNFTYYVMKNYSEVDLITYLDADLLFYSDVEEIFSEIGDASIAIIEHRFTPRLRSREVMGRFCVQWVSFRRDNEGLLCLCRWSRQCLDWCFYRLEDGKMGDQKYLDEWPLLYNNCHIIQNLGAGVAPWNFDQYSFEVDHKNRIIVNGSLLIFYHFHQFSLLSDGGFDRISQIYTKKSEVPNVIYTAYEEELRRCVVLVQSVDNNFSYGFKSKSQISKRRFIQRFVPMSVKDFGRRWFRL